MKTREIRGIIEAQGMERGVIYVLEAMNEDVVNSRREMVVMAGMLNKMLDILNSLTVVGDNMKSTIEKLNQEAAEPDLGPNTLRIGEN